MAVAPDVFDTLFRVWVKEGSRAKEGRKSTGLKRTIHEMDALYEATNQSVHCVTLFRSLCNHTDKHPRCVFHFHWDNHARFGLQ